MKKKDKEKIYWASIIGVVGLALYFYLNPFQTDGTVHSGCDICIDSDNPGIYPYSSAYVKGTVTCIRQPTNITFTETDYCSGNYLQEYECRNVPGSDEYDLYLNEIIPAGKTCVDGRYLQEGETTSTTNHIITTTRIGDTTTTTLCTDGCGKGIPGIYMGLGATLLVGGLFLFMYKKK